jgi:hypothetical protein
MDHSGVSPVRAGVGCSAGGVDSLSAPLLGAQEPVHLQLAQQEQLELAAIDVQLQQLLQVRAFGWFSHRVLCTRVSSWFCHLTFSEHPHKAILSYKRRHNLK